MRCPKCGGSKSSVVESLSPIVTNFAIVCVSFNYIYLPESPQGGFRSFFTFRYSRNLRFLLLLSYLSGI